MIVTSITGGSITTYGSTALPTVYDRIAELRAHNQTNWDRLARLLDRVVVVQAAMQRDPRKAKEIIAEIVFTDIAIDDCLKELINDEDSRS